MALQIQKSEISLRQKAKENLAWRADPLLNSAKGEPVHVDKELAKSAGVSQDTVQRVRYLVANADDDTLARLRTGVTSINSEYARVRKTKRQGVQSEESTAPVLAAISGNSADVMHAIASLYFRTGDKIADVTEGQRVFWKRLDLGEYDVDFSDIATSDTHAFDFRDLPYPDGDYDVAVFDPPFLHGQNTGQSYLEDCYQLASTTSGFGHEDIMGMYRAGAAECHRVLRTGGLLVVKCHDSIISSVQHRGHIDIWRYATSELEMEDIDMFIQVRTSIPPLATPQKHARKNFSYWYVFKRTI